MSSKPRLTQHAIDALTNLGWDGFTKRYGPEYVAGIITGGSYFGLIELATTTIDEQIEIKAKLGLSTAASVVKVDTSVENAITSKITSKINTVQVYQSGGSGDPLETDINEMIQQAKAFATIARDNPIPFQIITRKYEDSIDNLPINLPNSNNLPYIKRRDVLEELGEKYQYFKDQRSNIDFVLRNLLSFEEYRTLSTDDLGRKRKALQADFAGCSEQMNAIEKSARQCLESLTACEVPTGYYQVLEPLPELGGELMSIKQLEERVKQLQKRLDEMRSGIEDGSIIAQKALMLRARDNNHWMKFHQTDTGNRESFELWRGDGAWFQLIKTNFADVALTIRSSEEFRWSSGNPPVKMWHSNSSAAFLTRVCGSFQGGGEYVQIFVGGDGHWYLGGDALSEQGVDAVARCIGRPTLSEW